MIGSHPGPVTAVDIELLYDTGCRAIWRCLLTFDGSKWHVAEMAPVDGADRRRDAPRYRVLRLRLPRSADERRHSLRRGSIPREVASDEIGATL